MCTPLSTENDDETFLLYCCNKTITAKEGKEAGVVGCKKCDTPYTICKECQENMNNVHPKDGYEDLVVVPIKGKLSWREMQAMAKSKAHGLPTREDVEKSGIKATGGVNLWMPVRRDDFKEDWVQIGTCGGTNKECYISYLDAYGTKYDHEFPPAKMEANHLPGPKANGFKGSILALKNRRAVNMNADVLKKTLHTLVDQKLEALEAHR